MNMNMNREYMYCPSCVQVLTLSPYLCWGINSAWIPK